MSAWIPVENKVLDHVIANIAAARTMAVTPPP